MSDYLFYTPISGWQVSSESVAAFERNQWQVWSGIRMQAMVGFRNIAVHNYQKLSLDIVRTILDEKLSDFR